MEITSSTFSTLAKELDDKFVIVTILLVFNSYIQWDSALVILYVCASTMKK